MGEVRYMISEAAKKLQVESHVLRYWEDELGLEIGRTDMGHRYYTEEDIQLFLCIQKLKNEGMLLRDLKFMIPELTAARKRLNAAKDDADASPDMPDEQTEETLSPDSKTAPLQGHSTPAASADNPAEDRYETDTRDTPAFTAAALADLAEPAQEGKPESSEAGNPLPESAALASPSPTPQEVDVIQVTQLEQVRSLIGDVLSDVVTSNNETLKKDISRKVTADVIREMDFLFQANERREEEHYRKLDVLIRQQQAGRREAARETPLGKLKKLLT